MKFEIVRQNIGDCGGYYYIIGGDNFKGMPEFLHKDLKLHRGTGYFDAGCDVTKAPGYYATKAEAERYLMTYRVKNMKFGVYNIGGTNWWYVTVNEKYKCLKYVWRDLKLHSFANIHDYCGGYFPSKHYAETVLREFKKKHSMAEDTIKINVEINGVTKHLCDLSEKTLLKIREASKPKPVPVFQVCNSFDGRRLVLRVTTQIADCVGRYIALDNNGKVCNEHIDDPANLNQYFTYDNSRELKLDEV